VAYDLAKLSEMVQEALTNSPGASLAKLAQQLAIDRHTLEKAVRTTTGKSFRQLRQKVLLKKSLKLLQNEPALSIKDVAFRVGYSSPQAFQRFIRRASGKTPGQIRTSASPKRVKKKRQNSS
jgi:AraC-like DNA-binding protein